MKAITQDTYGSADVLKFHDIDMPVARAGEVLVRVHAAAVDAGVWHLMTGKPYLVRLAYGLRRPKSAVRGREFAGRVETDGAQFRAGDEVFGIAEGTFAEYVCAKEDKIAKKPANLTLEQASAIPISAITALHAIRDTGKVQTGQKVLVIGAAGGVGTYAVQLAKAYGADVTGVCSTTKVDLVRSIGADHVIDYKTEDIPAGRYDVVLDIAGNRPVSRLRRALTPRGTLIFVGGEEGGPVLGGMGRMLGAIMLSPFVSHNLRGLLPGERKADLEFLRGLIEDGKVTPVIDRTHTLTEVPDAVRYLQAGNARGKIVIIV